MLSKKQSRFMGKKLGLVLFLIIVLAVVNKIISNPIMIFYINEFMFDSTGWKMELHPTYAEQDSILLDGWCLTSKTDTAYFKNGTYFYPADYTVISQNDLQTHLDINPVNEVLTLYDKESFFSDRISFGDNDIEWYSAPNPKIGQSICLRVYYDDGYWQQSDYYLDNTPTMGFENDTTNAKGYIEGFIKDSLNNPIEGVKVIYDYIEVPPNGSQPVYIETNSSGYFSYYDFSISKWLEFEKEGYAAPDTSVQIWPDSTETINIQMKAVVGITELPSPTASNFQLTQNYPNPFNSSTSFVYSIADDDYVEINIYDEKGELVQRLFKSYQNKGEYKVSWNADNLASGIYFYELKTGSNKVSKKCILLK